MSTIKADTISDRAGSVSVPTATVVAGSAKAWVSFNGTGTVAIRASYNVSSITDTGVGTYTINFTNAMADTNYATAFSAITPSVSNGIAMLGTINTTSVQVVTVTNVTPQTATDLSYIHGVVFR